MSNNFFKKLKNTDFGITTKKFYIVSAFMLVIWGIVALIRFIYGIAIPRFISYPLVIASFYWGFIFNMFVWSWVKEQKLEYEILKQAIKRKKEQEKLLTITIQKNETRD